ncbi:MAG: hypothetical protein ACPL5F_00540 [Moorellaceae bacterium]
MRIIITSHGRKRLKELRQEGILLEDVLSAARQLPGRIAVATRFRGFVAESGRYFDLVIKDVPAGRLVITVIGK